MKFFIEGTYKTPRGTEVNFHTEELRAKHILLIIEDMESLNRVQRFKLVDCYGSSWTVKELRKYLKELETEPHDLTVYFDGGFDEKTMEAGLGCVIYYEQNGKSYRMRRNAFVEELTSNNEAEYAALHLCLKELEMMGAGHLPVRFVGDSRVVIQHLTEEWPVIEKNLYNWADRIEEKIKSLHINPEYQLVPRQKNKEADRLATQALQGIEVSATIER